MIESFQERVLDELNEENLAIFRGQTSSDPHSLLSTKTMSGRWIHVAFRDVDNKALATLMRKWEK